MESEEKPTKKSEADQKAIDTGGGAYIGGSVNTSGGDFIGRDRIVHGDEVRGDKVSGDYISGQVGAGSSDVIIGKNIRKSGNVTNVGRDQLTNSGSANMNTGNINSMNTQYKPKSWERILALVAAISWIGLVGFLVIRNEPLDPNLTVFVRIILSVMAGILGAVIPGFLSIDLKGAGFAIRAGGALALFVISYFFTPTVIS
jgi:hypothetical protein